MTVISREGSPRAANVDLLTFFFVCFRAREEEEEEEEEVVK